MDVLLAPIWSYGDHVLAAVSGGADSVALLMMLKEAQDRGEMRLSAAHFEHGIRGKASLSDARFVEALCAKLGVPCIIGHADVPALARQRGIGQEQAARDARHAFLLSTMRQLGADVIALAHHRDDQAETVLMHLLRGAGLRGAAGMRPQDGPLIRPLLGVGKAELTQYLGEIGQDYVTDQTNFEPGSPRNQLRLNAMPELLKVYPGASGALCRYATIADEEDFLLDASAQEWLNLHARMLPMGTRIQVNRDAPPAMIRRALCKLVPEPSFESLQRLVGLCFQDRGKLSLPGGIMAERAGSALYLLNPNVDKPAETRLRHGASLMNLGTIRMLPCEPTPRRDDPYCQALSTRAIEGAVLRVRRPGDRFRMLGAPGDRLLSDVLIDKKVERPLRDFLPLVAAGERVLWIPGLGISEEAKLTGLEPALRLSYEGERLI